MIEYADAKKIAVMLAAVAEPTRMKIAHQLARGGPKHVGELADLVGVPMVNMSHHLGVMRTAGVLLDEKEGRRVLYRFHPDVFAEGGNGSDVLGTLSMGGYTVRLVNPDGNGKKKGK